MTFVIWVLIAFAICWAITLIALLTKGETYKSAFDRLTGGKYRADKDTLQIMLDHFRSFPNEWSVSTTQVSYPLEGAKKYNLFLDSDKGWQYSLESYGGRPRQLTGHYAAEFGKTISKENNTREKLSALRDFYPELSDTLMLESR